MSPGSTKKKGVGTGDPDPGPIDRFGGGTGTRIPRSPGAHLGTRLAQNVVSELFGVL